MLLVKDPELVSCADLLVPRVGELCGGSLREYDHEALKERLERQYLPIKQRNSGEQTLLVPSVGPRHSKRKWSRSAQRKARKSLLTICMLFISLRG